MNGGMYGRLVADTSSYAYISMCVRAHACMPYVYTNQPFSCKKFEGIGDDCACEW